jgi:coenzyme F420-0:L-glutamate ligase/coenzyme F420-1:gamma-L-glutamate ligase
MTRKDPRLVELILRESTEVLRARPDVLIVRHRLGFVMANAGIDRSNVGGADRVLLLPSDPDGSADALRAKLAAHFGLEMGLVISDSFGRPWRKGVTNVALGAAGVPSLLDRRGELDRNGRRLEITEVALADLLASAAGLVMGEGAESRPAALLRGLSWNAAPRPASALIRPLQEDLFR